MHKIDYDDVLYTASLIEFLGRRTKNKRKDIAITIGLPGFYRLLTLAEVNHCLSFEQVSDEIIKRYDISMGDFNTVATCKYQVPSHISIGSVYAKLVTKIEKDSSNYADALYNVLTSGIAEAISNFNSALFYSSSDEVEYIYRNRYLKK